MKARDRIKYGSSSARDLPETVALIDSEGTVSDVPVSVAVTAIRDNAETEVYAHAERVMSVRLDINRQRLLEEVWQQFLAGSIS